MIACVTSTCLFALLLRDLALLDQQPVGPAVALDCWVPSYLKHVVGAVMQVVQGATQKLIEWYAERAVGAQVRPVVLQLERCSSVEPGLPGVWISSGHWS